MTVQMSGNQDTLKPKISHQTRIGSPVARTVEGSDVTNMTLSHATLLSPMPKVPVRYPAHLSDDDAASAIPEVQEPVSPSADTPTTFGKSPPASNNQNTATPTNNPDVGKIRTPADLTPMLTRSPSGRLIKPTRNPDFVYNPV